MNEKEALKKLIDNPKQPNVSEWVYEVEAFLEEINENYSLNLLKRYTISILYIK